MEIYNSNESCCQSYKHLGQFKGESEIKNKTIFIRSNTTINSVVPEFVNAFQLYKK
ncbi:unnamed protein product [Paramecium octaurelia]|uniref:Uncharacterized protein n=1 Tax=Paramecium octaurelia TaxID=43137 RepID=A0A8S1Y5N3_PAROT|nr:unnamed protein product [Paramecium octaurelia]